MATIIEGALWTLTEEAAQRMVENGLIALCTRKHTNYPDLGEADLPIYHRACDAPDWFGIATLPGAIQSAETHANAGATQEMTS